MYSPNDRSVEEISKIVGTSKDVVRRVVMALKLFEERDERRRRENENRDPSVYFWHAAWTAAMNAKSEPEYNHTNECNTCKGTGVIGTIFDPDDYGTDGADIVCTSCDGSGTNAPFGMNSHD